MSFRIILAVLLNILSISTASSNENDEIDLKLVAFWKKTPFKLNVLESISSFDDSLYLPLVNQLLGVSTIQEDEDSPIEVILNEDFSQSDKEFYDAAFGLVESKIDQSLIDIELASKIHSPRIQAQYEYYNISIFPKSYCLGIEDDKEISAFLVQGDNVYCESKDVFALKTITNPISLDDIILPFDRVIGDSPNIFVLYGDYKSTEFKTFFSHLYQEALAGKLSFIWRYLPDKTNSVLENEIISGYGIDLTLKRTDYIAIDDRGFSIEQQAKMNFEKQDESQHVESIDEVTENEFWNDYSADIQPVKKEDIKELGFQLVNLVLTHSKDPREQLDLLNALVQDFPKFVSSISKFQLSENELELTESVLQNKESGVPDGVYINGAPVADLKSSIFEVLRVLKKELVRINNFSQAGISTTDAKKLVTEFTSSIETLFKDPSKSLTRYDLSSREDGIIFFNNIEDDYNYRMYKPAKIMYRDISNLQEIPKARENIHDVVFLFSPTDPGRLYYFLALTFQSLQGRVAQRIGYVPIIKNPEDEIIVKQLTYLYETKSSEEVLQYLKLLLQLQGDGEGLSKESLEQLELPEDFKNKDLTSKFESFKKTFGITESPLVIVNGIMYTFDGSFKNAVISQTLFDIELLHNALRNKEIPKGTSFRKYLRKDALPERNQHLIPDSVDVVASRYRTPFSFNQHVEFLKTGKFISIVQNCEDEDDDCAAFKSFTLIGDFSTDTFRDQIINTLKYAESSDNVKVRIIDYSNDGDFEKLNDAIKESISQGLEFVKTLNAPIKLSLNESIVNLIKSTYPISNFADSEMYLLFNGRFVDLSDGVISPEQIKALDVYETRLRLQSIHESLSGTKYSKPIEGLDKFDWFDCLSSLITDTYFFDDGEYFVGSSAPRYSLNTLDDSTSIKVPATSGEESIIDVTIIIDPISEKAQKYLSYLSLFENMDFVSTNVVMRPSAEIEEVQIKRFYRGNFPSKVIFNELGELDETHSNILFDKVPEKTLFTLDVDVPQSWIVGIREAETDLDNVKLDISGSIKGVYELEHLLIEGYARNLKKETVPPAGLAVELTDLENNKVYSDTNIMSNLGYLQLKANPGVWKFGIKQNENSEGSVDFSLLRSFDVFKRVKTLGLEHEKPKKYIELAVLDLNGRVIYPVFNKIESDKERKELNDLHGKSSSSVGSFFKGLISSSSSSSVPKKVKQANINIFTLASGHLYERFLGIMTASVRAHTDHTVKFWFLENYMSPKLKKELPILAEHYNFKYELITYKWPSWLTSQREKQRTIWGYKILFLDVLFPQDLEKVIFVDSDQIVRTDLQELVDFDLEGAPYGYTPMCDSRTEMEGFRFWKTGYWQKTLYDNGLKYHISALYVIDLNQFRSIKAGDKLRQHYQALSLDPNSLSNLDQDLPNDMQRTIKIKSLPQDWLWCETWCSDGALKTAKTIDLCNNPLTKEPKLDRARRQIPEWTKYDDEIVGLLENKFDIGEQEGEDENIHDEL